LNFSNKPAARIRKLSKEKSDMELPIEAHRRIVVGTLAPGITHEINNYVNNIALTADLLLEDYEGLSDAERLDMVSDIVKESEKAKIVAQNLSRFIEENDTGFEPHYIASIIDDVLRLAGKHIKRSRVKVKGELAPNLPRIRCVRWKIEHVFLNIILNAIDAMPGGGILTITCGSAKDGESVSIEFTDTGPGISTEITSDLFKPSFTTKSRTHALGLGLPVCQKMVEEHKGEIQIRSQVGKGALITVSLPISESP
jgi:signal transduction histidine kinase